MDYPYFDEPYPTPNSSQIELSQQIWTRLTGEHLDRALGVAVIAYFLRYGYLIGNIDEAADSLKRAPWILADAVELKAILQHLVAQRLVVVRQHPDFLNLSPSPALGVACAVTLTGRPSVGDEALNRTIVSAWHQARRDAGERANLLHIEGWAGASNILKRLRLALHEIQDDQRLKAYPVIIKVVSYHGGTWFGTRGTPGVLHSLLSDFQALRLRFQISIVSPKTHPRGLEGASISSHRSASENSLVNLASQQELPSGTFDVRYHGELERDLHFRGVIISARGAIQHVSGVTWRAGIDRALYGLDTELDRRSNIARLCEMYVDDVFRRGVPVGSSYQKIWFYLSENAYALIGAIIWTTTIIAEAKLGAHGISHIGTVVFAAMFHDAPLLTRIKQSSESHLRQ